METPLSPRSLNVPSKHSTISKADSGSKRTLTKEEAAQAKAAADRKAEKDKNHASPPPEYVIQPPGQDGALGEKYHTGKLLGKGGFAICYEGRLVGQKYAGKNHKFALKIVKARMGMKKMEEKFRTELQIHSKMRHPNIVEFHRAFTFLENTYVVLELCPNGSVMDMVRKRRCLSLPEVRRYAVQLCGAIKYMHARNVIHRDLKMGNLFLDHDMNIKIGDFGLAAILVTESEVKGAKRRTTLCGTPNYIAPEILEKKGKGHDHKVDIWAIGIILFAMITGYPPFASTSQDDIYRKVKSLEYVWPTEKCLNDIPEEAKSLVASLLKSKAEDRPDPDYIVAHPFFSMNGCLAIPLALDPETCIKKPVWLEQKAPRGDAMASDTERISIFALAKRCGVGHFPEADRAFPVVGGDIEKSIWKECIQEEADGRTPIVPLPDDTVYSSHSSSSTFVEDFTTEILQPHRKPDSSTISIRSISDPSVRIIPRDSRSHAAQLRSEAGSRMAKPVNRVARDVAASKPTYHRQHPTVSGASSRGKLVSTQGFLEGLPLRPASATVPEARQAQTLPKNFSRMTRSAAIVNGLNESSSRDLIPARSTAPSLTSSHTSTASRSVSDSSLVPGRERCERNTRARRVVATVEQKLLETVASRKTANIENKTSDRGSSKNDTAIPDPACMLIDSKEDAEEVRDTKPDDILRKLRMLSSRLSTELANAARATDDFDITDDSIPDSVHARPVVVKWVDYTNKFGIGYILANSSVGCVFNGSQERASTCIMVPQAEEHLKRRKSPTYVEKHQLVPRSGLPIEFIENCGNRGMRRVSASPRNYRVNIGPHGTPGKLSPGTDSFDSEKRRTLILWDKFAKYMTQTLGKGGDNIPDTEPISQPQSHPTKNSNSTSTWSPPFVRFYQRLGNVGIWGFGDGAFQFNFPDHTKLVVSADGLDADFYHLSISATQILRKGGLLPKSALDERSVLSSRLAVLLRGGKGGVWMDVLVANELVKKVRFVRDVVGMWVGGGGLGLGLGLMNGMDGKGLTSGGEAKVKWEGLREVGGREKLVWVTVGARGGDGRVEVLSEIKEGIKEGSGVKEAKKV